ncbi:MAG TPA: lysophospholipid acyltransferase family protein [Gaiellaceae bacterium]|nr:lysophospholipid acyltransferase family protein [Gaiellaceae bacterium]
MKPVDLVYWTVGKGVVGSVVRAIVPLKAYGKERVPREGGAVLAVNHFSYVDPPAIGVLCPRRIVFVAKTELFDVPVVSWFIRSHGTLAVRRGESDRDALRRMRASVRENELLGLFVEGTRQRSGELGTAKPGAAMIAIQEGVPVVPAAIHGSQHWRPRNRVPVSIAFGEPMRFAEHPRNSRGYAAATREIEAEIRRLWEFLVRMHELGRPPGVPPRRAEVPMKTA